MGKVFDIQEIMNILPHRYPFILVDRILELIPGEKVVALKNVTINEPFFSGHFPGEPVLPGVAQLEMTLDAIKRLNPKSLRISGVKRVRFKQVVRPDDRLKLTVTPHKKEALSYLFRITVNGELAGSGILMVEEINQ